MLRWFGKLFCLCVLVVALPVGAAQQDAATAPTGWFEAAKTDWDVFSSRLLADAKATFFDGGNVVALTGAGLASAAMNDGGVDDDVADHFDKHNTFDSFSEKALFVIGMPATHFAGTALWYVLAAEDQDDPGRQQAVTMLSALTITGAVTAGLKAIRHNDGPNGRAWA